MDLLPVQAQPIVRRGAGTGGRRPAAFDGGADQSWEPVWWWPFEGGADQSYDWWINFPSER